MSRRLWCVVLLCALIPNVPAESQTERQARFAFERPVATSGPGPQKLAVDEPLLSGGRPFRVIRRGSRFIAEDGLDDLRLFDSGGVAVPHLLVRPPAADPLWVAGRILPVPSTKKSSGFEADFGRAQVIDTIRVEGIPAPFLKRLSVEGSGDRTRWTSLAPDATLFDLPSEDLQQLDVSFVPGAYRYVRVTWDDTNSARVPRPRIVRARLAPEQPPEARASIELAFERLPSEPGRSRYRVRLPAPKFPVTAIELDVAGGHVFRPAAVSESRFAGAEAAPVVLGRATLSRVVQGGVHAADLRVPIDPPAEADLQLTIEDGSNPPLGLRRVVAHLAELPVVYFEAPGGPVVARYGDPHLAAPAFDLEAARKSIDLRRVPGATWGAPRALVESSIGRAGSEMPQPGGTLDPAGFRDVRAIPSGPGGLVALQLDAAALAHSRGPAVRFADVRVLDASNRQVPYLVERRDEPLAIELDVEPAAARAAELERGPGRSVSVYRLRLPYRNLPPAAVVLETSARVFRRSVQLGIEREPDRTHREPWLEVLASETWQHAAQETLAPAVSLRIQSLNQTELLLAVDEGDNAPLPVSGARLLLPSYRLRFYQPAGTRLRLAYGRGDLQAPQYDLALLAQQVMGASAQDLSPGPPSQPSSPDGREVMSPRVFWILIGGAAVVLVGVIVRLLAARSP